MSVPSHSQTPFINLFYHDLGFQQDTFATDSLQHILALLTSLNSHSFSLLTSLSLTNRSRVKDLWIFTGPAPERFPPVETPKLNATVSNVIRVPLQGFSTEANIPIDVPQQHKRFATESTPHLPSQHSQAITDSPLRSQHPAVPSPQPHLLRKPAPRAQVPVSVFRDSDTPDEHHQVFRAHMPSIISTGVEDMTGVGAVGLKQDVSSTSSPPATPQPKAGGRAAHERSDFRLRDKVATPLLLTSTPPKQLPQSNAKNEKSIHNDLSSPPLLGMSVFRDSVFSSNSTTPSGSYKKDAKPEQEPSYSSSGLIFPGGWQSTPVDEKVEEETEISTSMSAGNGAASTPIHENDCRIEAPAITTPDMSLRKSEAALIGMIASTSYAPSRMKESQNSLRNGSQGWVLVNVEGSNAVRPVFGSESARPNDTATPRPTDPNSPLSASASTPHTSKSPASEQPSPAAKAIVIIDAMDSKQKKRSTMQPKESGEGRTGLKRFFSLNKKNLVSEESSEFVSNNGLNHYNRDSGN
jgi:hypothetical protein